MIDVVDVAVLFPFWDHLVQVMALFLTCGVNLLANEEHDLISLIFQFFLPSLFKITMLVEKILN